MIVALVTVARLPPRDVPYLFKRSQLSGKCSSHLPHPSYPPSSTYGVAHAKPSLLQQVEERVDQKADEGTGR